MMRHMKTSTALLITLVVVLACAAFSSCALFTPRGQVSVAEISDTVVIVVGRHDSYVAADATLEEESRHAALQQSTMLLKLMQQESVSQAALKSLASPVCDRHDSYVHLDTTLTELQASVYQDSTDALRTVWSAGK